MNFAYANKNEGDSAKLTESVFNIVVPGAPCAWKESIGIRDSHNACAGFRRGAKFSLVPVQVDFMGGSYIVGLSNVTPTFGNTATGDTFLFGKMSNDLKRLVVRAVIVAPGASGFAYDLYTDEETINRFLVKCKKEKEDKRKQKEGSQAAKGKRKRESQDEPANKRARMEEPVVDVVVDVDNHEEGDYADTAFTPENAGCLDQPHADVRDAPLPEASSEAPLDDGGNNHTDIQEGQVAPVPGPSSDALPDSGVSDFGTDVFFDLKDSNSFASYLPSSTGVDVVSMFPTSPFRNSDDPFEDFF